MDENLYLPAFIVTEDIALLCRADICIEIVCVAPTSELFGQVYFLAKQQLKPTALLQNLENWYCRLIRTGTFLPFSAKQKL